MDPLIFTSQFSLFYTRTYWQLIPNGNLGLDPDVGIFFVWQSYVQLLCLYIIQDMFGKYFM